MKRLICLAMSFAMMFTLCACGKNADTTAVSEDSEQLLVPDETSQSSPLSPSTDRVPTEEPGSDTLTTPASEPTPEPTPTVTIEKAFRCLILQDEFSEGIALVAYTPSGANHYLVGIIDQNGQITSVNGIPAFSQWKQVYFGGSSQTIKCSPFYEGKCYATLVDDNGESHVYCISADGTVEEIWGDHANTTYEYITSGDGIHLFKQSIKSYNTDEENTVVFDQKSGATEVCQYTKDECTYHGEGFFSLWSRGLSKFQFNDAIDSLQIVNAIDTNYISGIENGYDEYGHQAIYYDTVHNGETFVLFGSDKRYGQTIYKVNDEGEWSLVAETSYNTWAVAYGDRVFIFHYEGYDCYKLEIKDLDGNTIFYGNNFFASDIVRCSDDKFILKIKGTDGNSAYVTVIDKNGNFAFEPIQMKYRYGQEDTSRLGEDHLIVESEKRGNASDFKIISVTGEVVSCNITESHGAYYALDIESAIFQNGVAILHGECYDCLLTLTGDAILPWYEVQQ